MMRKAILTALLAGLAALSHTAPVPRTADATKARSIEYDDAAPEVLSVGRPGPEACRQAGGRRRPHGASGGRDVGACYPLTIDPTIVNEDAKLTASDAARADTFGKRVSISGDTVVVGADLDGCATGRDCGSAYVFEKPHERLVGCPD